MQMRQGLRTRRDPPQPPAHNDFNTFKYYFNNFQIMKNVEIFITSVEMQVENVKNGWKIVL